MSFELVYKSLHGNLNYWSVKSRFTRKKNDHYQWGSLFQMKEDLAKLVDHYPTLFANKNQRRFFSLDLSSAQLTLIDSCPNQKEANKGGNPSLPGYVPPLITKDGKNYAVVIDANDWRYYFCTTKQIFTRHLTTEVKRWREIAKAAKTAEIIRSNHQLWDKYPKWNPQSTFVINLQTGKAVWPATELTENLVSFESNPGSASSGISLLLLDRLDQQLLGHFEQTRNPPLLGHFSDYTVPPIDLQKYQPSKVFRALAYLVEAMGQKGFVDQALKAYDHGLTQDFLHTAELVEVSKVDSQHFLSHLQAMLRRRRQIKDLHIILQALANHVDSVALLKELLQNSSLKNQYYYRNAKNGRQLMELFEDHQSSTQS